MYNLEQKFLTKFEIEKLFIHNCGKWIISLRPSQPTIGSLLISLNRKCEKLSLITTDEGKELAETFSFIEKLYQKTFNPDKINFLALMMFDEQVHFHVIPRYEKAVKFKGENYVDNAWPGPPSLSPMEFPSSKVSELHEVFVANV